MDKIIENFTNPMFIIDFCISLLLVGVISFFLLLFMKRKFVICSVVITDLIFVVGKVFDFSSITLVALLYLFSSAIVFVVMNGSEYRYYVLNNVRSKRKISKENYISKENINKMIFDTVMNLSKNKIGAIITFEKTTNLNDIIKNGTLLNAPICPELLMTIFYPGTRLHDGAVVIRGDKILAASVYYTPTTRALTGKYGSRQRAAFGISEISDAVTIVVSEETGRISLTYKGRMESTTHDSFLSDFTSLMDDRGE